MIIIPKGGIVRVYHRIKTPTHWQHEDEALRHHNRIGMVIEKMDNNPWINVYQILVGKEKVELGRGWILYPYNKPPI